MGRSWYHMYPNLEEEEFEIMATVKNIIYVNKKTVTHFSKVKKIKMWICAHTDRRWHRGRY